MITALLNAPEVLLISSRVEVSSDVAVVPGGAAKHPASTMDIHAAAGALLMSVPRRELVSQHYAVTRIAPLAALSERARGPRCGSPQLDDLGPLQRKGLPLASTVAAFTFSPDRRTI